MADPFKPTRQFKARPANKSKGILDDTPIRKTISTRQGTITHVPAEENDITNKEYVDSLIRGNVELFLTEDASDIGTYFDLATDSTGNPEENTVQAIAANSTTLIAAYASILNEAEIESITDLEQGIYSMHVHASANFPVGMTVYFEFYRRTSGGVETLLGTSHDSDTLSATESQEQLHANILEDLMWDTGDRVVVKVYGRNGNAASKNITIFVEGDTLSRVEFPAFIPPAAGGGFTGTEGSIPFVAADGTLTEDNFNLFWDRVTHELQPHHMKIVSDGTQASPALKFNDTNTGFYKLGDNVNFSLNNSTILGMNATGLDMKTHKIVGVVDPTTDQEAATKKYVDDNAGVLTSSYDTGWINRSDWTNVHMGTNTTLNTDSNVTHSLGVPLSDLLVRVLISTDGTDANSFEIQQATSTSNSLGVMTYAVDNDNVLVQTGSIGVIRLTGAGVSDGITTDDWYYKIKVYKLA